MKAKLLIILCSFGLFLTGCANNCNGCYTNFSYNGTCCMIPNSNGASECDFTDIASMGPSCGYGVYNSCGSSYGCGGGGCAVNSAYDTGRCSSCNW